MSPRKVAPARFGWIVPSVFFAFCTAVVAQTSYTEAANAEMERSARQIREVRVEIGNRYEKKLAELRGAYQKAADLENALLVRAELQRVTAEGERPLDASNLVEEPRLLKEAQAELLAKQSEMIAQIVQSTVPKLVEIKKALTVAGKLDEAVEVRSAILRLQDDASPAQRLSNNSVVAVEEVLQAYQASRERADTIYKGPRLLLRGKVAGVRPDPKDPSSVTLVLFGGTDGSLVDCAFSVAEYRVREERVGQNLVYVVSRTNNDPNVLRAQRGMVVEISGKCEGADGPLRFGNCNLPKR